MIIGILSLSYLVGDAAARGEHGRADRARLLVAGAVLLCGRGDGAVLRRELVPAARIAQRRRASRGQTNPLNLFARRAYPTARQRAGLLGPLLAQPRLPAGLPALARVHHHPRDVQHLDAGVPARLPGLLDRRRRGHERHIPGGRRRLGAAERLAERSAGSERARAAAVRRPRRDGRGAARADDAAAPAAPIHRCPLVGIGIVAFCLLGPYSYLGGAFALDFGGKQASAMSSGIIDGVGYLGAVAAGDSVARISVARAGRACS